jgi:Uma2 family endonuclease
MPATIIAAGYDLRVATATSAHALPFDDLHRLSTDEYERIVATGALEGMRVELLDGLLVDMSPQGERHMRAIGKLVIRCAGRPELLRVQGPLPAGEGWMPEPDVALVEHGPDPDVRPTTALLVVEVAVTSQVRDTRKAPVYARAGIPIYWLIDLPAGIVRVHTKPGPTGYASIVAKTGDDVLDANVEGVPQTTVAALLEL